MDGDLQLNADRFLGFADIYDDARPKCPEKVKEIILKYLGRAPALVIDIGCGTGLSTRVWSDASKKVVGIEPSTDMIKTAREKSIGLHNIKYVNAFSDNTGLDSNCADIITCSQAFHWMNPETTLNEASRVLKEGGILAVYDYDWPPVCNLEAEIEYNKLSRKTKEIETTHPGVKDSFVRWSKSGHLTNIKNSGKFRYVREILFSSSESCNAKRFIECALSHGGLQSVIKASKDEIEPYLNVFEERIWDIFGNAEFSIEIPYRMRIGIK